MVGKQHSTHGGWCLCLPLSDSWQTGVWLMAHLHSTSTQHTTQHTPHIVSIAQHCCTTPPLSMLWLYWRADCLWVYYSIATYCTVYILVLGFHGCAGCVKDILFAFNNPWNVTKQLTYMEIRDKSLTSSSSVWCAAVWGILLSPYSLLEYCGMTLCFLFPLSIHTAGSINHSTHIVLLVDPPPPCRTSLWCNQE